MHQRGMTSCGGLAWYYSVRRENTRHLIVCLLFISCRKSHSLRSYSLSFWWCFEVFEAWIFALCQPKKNVNVTQSEVIPKSKTSHLDMKQLTDSYPDDWVWTYRTGPPWNIMRSNVMTPQTKIFVQTKILFSVEKNLIEKRLQEFL